MWTEVDGWTDGRKSVRRGLTWTKPKVVQIKSVQSEKSISVKYELDHRFDGPSLSWEQRTKRVNFKEWTQKFILHFSKVKY